MKRFIQFVSLILVLSMCLVTPAFAAEEVSPWASSYFMSRSAYLTVVSGTTFDVWFEVTAVRGMDEIGTSVIKVQRSTDKSDWDTVKTFTKESYANMIDYNTADHSDSVRYVGTSGYYYRAYVEFYAKDDTGTAYHTYYTSSIKL